MKLFFIEWIGGKFGMTEIVRELKRDHKILYWSGSNLAEAANQEEFSGTIFHDHFDVLRGISPVGIDARKFMPPGTELLDKLLGAESAVLTMMSKTFENVSVNERKHLYYNYVRYWRGVLDKFKPDAIIFPNVPHTVYDFVLYSLAKLMGIKTIMFELTRINDRALIENYFETGSAALRGEIEKNRGKNFSLSDLSPDIQEYYKTQINFKANVRPKDIVELSEKYSGLKSLKVKMRSFWTTITVLKDFSVFAKILTYLLRRFRPNQRVEYLSLAEVPDFSKKFIYVPLQYQPECTTSPLGGIFADQLLMIEILSAALPADWLIYVKEHPLQWKPRGLDYFSYRYKGFYKNIASLPNVLIIPIETDSLTLIDKSQCVASVNGTAGWEALLRNKPSLAFGYAWYRDCPGVFKINDTESCRRAVSEISRGFKVTSREIINYLYSFDKISMQGFREQYCQDVSSLSVEQNIASHVRALNSAFKKDEL